MAECVFCAIVAGQAPAEYVWRWDDAIAILPREDEDGCRGCTEGHILVIPYIHVRDFTESEHVSAATAARTSELARHLGGQWNEITSAGPDATQTVHHLHRHLVPRRPDDGLMLPWTDQPGYVRRLVASATGHMARANHEAEVGRRLRGELAVAREQWRRTAVKLALTNGTAFYRLTTPEVDALRSAIEQQREREAIAADVLAERTGDAASGEDGAP